MVFSLYELALLIVQGRMLSEADVRMMILVRSKRWR